MTTSNAEEPTASAGGVSRRGVLKAAAWSAPVVAVAVAAPLASASPTSSSLVKYGTSSVAIVPQTPVVNDSVSITVTNGAFGLFNITGSWNTGAVTAEVTTLTGLSGVTYWGAGSELEVDSILTASDGGTWVVTSLSPFKLQRSAGVQVSANSNQPVVIPFPVFEIRGTFQARGDVGITLATANIPGTILTGGSFG